MSVQPGTILLVEDEPEVADFLIDLFSLDGWRVEAVSNGRQALERLASAEYEVILSDLIMPEVDGAALYREVARHRAEMLPRFIFMSGFDDSEVADFIKQTRAPMISKPFRFKEIREAIQDVCGPPAPSVA